MEHVIAVLIVSPVLLMMAEVKKWLMKQLAKLLCVLKICTKY